MRQRAIAKESASQGQVTAGCSDFQEKMVSNEEFSSHLLCAIKKKKKRIMYTLLFINKENVELFLEQALSKNHRTALRKEQVGYL